MLYNVIAGIGNVIKTSLYWRKHERATRSMWWLQKLFIIIFLIMGGSVSDFFVFLKAQGYDFISLIGDFGVNLYILILVGIVFYSFINISLKRLTDAGYSWYLILLLPIPGINLIPLLIFIFAPSVTILKDGHGKEITNSTLKKFFMVAFNKSTNYSITKKEFIAVIVFSFFFITLTRFLILLLSGIFAGILNFDLLVMGKFPELVTGIISIGLFAYSCFLGYRRIK